MSAKYIVVFKDHVSAAQVDSYADELTQNGGTVSQRYDPIMKGFAASIPDAFLTRLQSLQGDVVDYIEPDGVMTTQ